MLRITARRILASTVATSCVYASSNVYGSALARGTSEEQRSVIKPDGRVITLASFTEMRSAVASGARVLDVRDTTEVLAGKGGRTVSDAIHVPLNVDGKPQSAHPTTRAEFLAALEAVSFCRTTCCLPTAFIVHCTGGGRAEKAVKHLRDLGFEALNGGGPDDVRECVDSVLLWKESELCADGCDCTVPSSAVIDHLEVVGYHGCPFLCAPCCSNQEPGRATGV